MSTNNVVGQVGIPQLATTTPKTLRKIVSTVRMYNHKSHRNGT
jgi:hypothetical protein